MQRPQDAGFRQGFELLSNAAQDAVWDWDLNTHSIWWNDSFRTLYGYSNNHIEEGAAFWQQCIHPGDRAQVLESMEEALRNGNAHWGHEFRFLKADGLYVLVRICASILHNEQGVPIRMAGFMKDMVPPDAARLNASNERFRLLQETMNDGVWEWDIVNDRMYWNAQFARIAGAEASGHQPLGALLNLIHPADVEKFREALFSCLEKNTPFRLKFRMVHPSGDVRYVLSQAKVLRDEEGRPISLLGVLADVTERKKTKQALTESEERFGILFQNAAIGIAITDASGRFLNTNPAYCAMTGYSEDELRQKTFQELTYPGDLPDNRQILENALNESANFKVEKRYVRKDGGVVWVELWGSHVKSEEGDVKYILAVARDITKKKKAEEERQKLHLQIEESQRLLQQLTNAAPVALWMSDESGNIVFMNQTWVDWTGRSFKENLGQGWLLSVPAEERQAVAENFRKAFLARRAFKDEFRICNKKGVCIWCIADGRPYFTAAGAFAGYVGSCVDISERKLTEQVLRESEERFRSLADQVPMLIWMSNASAEVTYCNKAMLDFLGFDTCSDFISESWRQAVHPEDIEQLVRVFALAFEAQSPFALECRMKEAASKQYRWLFYKGVPRRLPDGTFSGFIGVAIDIHNRKLVEEALVDKEERLRMAMESAEMGTWEFSPLTGKLNFSPRCKELFGLPTDAHIDYQLFLQGLHPDDVERTNRAGRYALDPVSGGHFDVEYRTIGLEDKKLRWIRAKGRAFFNPEGVAYRLIGTVLDITEQKQVEEILKHSAEMLEKRVQERTHELQEANEHLARSNAELEQFAYIASHDLQEPLRKILIFSDQLQTQASQHLDENAQTWVQKMRVSAQRMSVLIKDLLDYSRLLHDAGQEQFASVDLNVVLEHILSDLEMPIQHMNADIQAGKLPVIEAVEVQMNQLFYNLIANSLKFVVPDRKPTIQIKASLLGQTEASQHALPEGKKYYKIVFADNGIGFEQEFAEQIFTVFQRLHTKEKFPGTGIGLALCRKVVENHNGVIYAEGREDKGATFVVILPASQQ